MEQPNSQEQVDVSKKQELLAKFYILSRTYPVARVPDFTEDSDLALMEREYDRMIRQLALDSDVDDYKRYLIGGFMAIEFLGIKYLKLEFDGYTRQQLRHMNKYERLLIELGEKSYMQRASRVPVEIRLIFIMLINAGLFLLVKIMSRNAGPQINQMFGVLFGGAAPESIGEDFTVGKPQRKMRGPTIHISDDEGPDKGHSKRKKE